MCCREEVMTMRLGVVLPTYEIPADPAALADFAQAAEQLGYSHLGVMDHVAGADLARRVHWEGRETLVDFHEPFVLFGYLAGVTRRLAFFTSVLVLPQRQTVLVAKQAAEVDVLSGGRLRLGVGVGWAEPEFQALNEDYRTRGARLEEQITVLRARFTQEAVTFHGRWRHLEEIGIRPRPLQRPIPIWLGGNAEASVRRVAAMGDGWFPLLAPDETARAAIERLHAYARAAGRDPQRIGIEGAVEIAGKTPDEWRREVEAWRALGATRIGVYMLDAGLASLQAHIEALARFKEAITSSEHT
jgi:probable F420-dependent oxidoreductase